MSYQASCTNLATLHTKAKKPRGVRPTNYATQPPPSQAIQHNPHNTQQTNNNPPNQHHANSGNDNKHTNRNTNPHTGDGAHHKLRRSRNELYYRSPQRARVNKRDSRPPFTQHNKNHSRIP